MSGVAMRIRAGVIARTSSWIGRLQRGVSTRVHAAGDERARAYGWEIRESIGRLGFGLRSYRDPASTTGVGNLPGGSPGR